VFRIAATQLLLSISYHINNDNKSSLLSGRKLQRMSILQKMSAQQRMSALQRMLTGQPRTPEMVRVDVVMQLVWTRRLRKHKETSL